METPLARLIVLKELTIPFFFEAERDDLLQIFQRLVKRFPLRVASFERRTLHNIHPILITLYEYRKLFLCHRRRVYHRAPSHAISVRMLHWTHMIDIPLHERTCVPCEGGTPPLSRERVEISLRDVPGWELHNGPPTSIARTVRCHDFSEACALFMRVALLCEAEGHHADIRVFGWRNIEFVLSTHAVGGLSDNDFIVAAKINALLA